MRRWIDQLAHPVADIRQLATRNLIRAGRRAVGPVAALVDDRNAEVALRARLVLLRMVYARNVADSDAARTALLELAQSGRRPVRHWAGAIQHRLEETAAETLQSNGVAVTFDYDANGRRFAKVDMSRWKGGTRALVNLRFLHRVGSLDLSKAKIDDDNVHWLSQLTSLTLLDLRESKVGNSGLKQLTRLKRLTELDLRETRVTGDGLRYLAKLKSLESLHLGSTQLSGSGLQYLKQLPALRVLNLAITNVGDDDLQPLAECSHLERLWLSHTRVGDAGLRYVGKLTNLHSLGLSNTKVTDAGLKHLYGLKHLQTLWLTRTAVTEQGVDALKQRLPMVVVRY